MKRTCYQKNTTCPGLSGNSFEQTTCEFHRVKMQIEVILYNHQLISNFNNLNR